MILIQVFTDCLLSIISMNRLLLYLPVPCTDSLLNLCMFINYHQFIFCQSLNLWIILLQIIDTQQRCVFKSLRNVHTNVSLINRIFYWYQILNFSYNSMIVDQINFILKWIRWFLEASTSWNVLSFCYFLFHYSKRVIKVLSFTNFLDLQ